MRNQDDDDDLHPIGSPSYSRRSYNDRRHDRRPESLEVEPRKPGVGQRRPLRRRKSSDQKRNRQHYLF